MLKAWGRCVKTAGISCGRRGRGKNNRNIAVETLRWKSNTKSNRAGLKA